MPRLAPLLVQPVRWCQPDSLFRGAGNALLPAVGNRGAPRAGISFQSLGNGNRRGGQGFTATLIEQSVRTPLPMKTYIILGGGGSFGVHTAMYLLANANPRKVISVGRNPEKAPPFTLDVGKGDPRYAYHQIHVTYEQDRLFELFDKEK